MLRYGYRLLFILKFHAFFWEAFLEMGGILFVLIWILGIICYLAASLYYSYIMICDVTGTIANFIRFVFLLLLSNYKLTIYFFNIIMLQVFLLRWQVSDPLWYLSR